MTDDAALALRARLPGVICATVTPFLPDSLEVDWAGVRANVDFLLARGVSALVVNGSIAEHSSMSHEEQIRAVRETVDAAAGAVPVIAGCSHTDPRVVVELCRSAAAAGADGAMLLAPYYFRLSPEEVEDFFRSIDGAIGMPFLLYDNPTTGQVELPAETIEAISRLRNFAALKEASQDVLRFHGLVERFGEQFPVIAAVEDPLLFMLVSGAPACMTATAAFAPELLGELMAAVAASDLPRARAIYRRLFAFRQLFLPQIRAGRPAFVAYTKAAIELVGGRAGPTRPPLRPIDPAERVRLAYVLEQAVGLRLAQTA